VRDPEEPRRTLHRSPIPAGLHRESSLVVETGSRSHELSDPRLEAAEPVVVHSDQRFQSGSDDWMRLGEAHELDARMSR
jgi:hypothetical protein